MQWWSDLKLRTSACTLVVLAAVLVVANYMLWENPKEFFTSVMVMVFGACLGWLSGLVASPYTDREASRFNSFSKAAGTFASGYLLAKADNLFSELMSKEFLLNFEIGIRMISFFCAFAIFFLITFIFRNYAPNTRLPNNVTDNAPE